ncbi:MAG TPA: RidA family protein [Bryobacteraceae bacterium]|nr:RidA family protein [Bryobacteraceae bacterium]
MAEILQPAHWPRPKGYSNGLVTSGRQVFLSGMIGWDSSGRLVSDNFVAQARQALLNIVELLALAQAGPEHIARMTWYVVNREEYLDCSKELGSMYREVIGWHYPAMSVVAVSGLMEAGARVEIEVTAVVPV